MVESAPLFEAENISVRFGGLVALDDVSLSVAPHQVHGVIGPNGAGKTTLFNVCCGFQRSGSGQIRWRGSAIRNLRAHQLADLGIARTLQGVGLFKGLTVMENVMVGADHRRRTGFFPALLALSRADADERRLHDIAMAALRELGVDSYAARLPESLPFPVQKRVAIARALAADPALLLLDEPASGLGHDEIKELGEFVRGLAACMSVVVVDHHMDFVMSICDQITVLDFGRVVATGTPSQIGHDPAVISAYLGEDTTRVEGSRHG